MMYKIEHNIAPSYLSNVIQHNEEAPHYNLRTKKSIKIPFCRLTLFKRSFFPSSIKLWNALQINVQTLPSYKSFKDHLKSQVDPPNELYYYGERWPSVHHARMRIGCSKLNNDLCYNLHVVNNPTCECGAPVEDAYHYFFQCPNYQAIRLILLHTVSNITVANIDTFLYGDTALSLVQNQTIFEAIHEFIKSTQRFN